ncbi:unnamed protein product [Closterium sp. NIES-54]
MGDGADKGPAIGAGAVVSVVASASADVAAASVVAASVDVAAAAVVSASTNVAATSVVCWITANALVCSASGIMYVTLQYCLSNVESALPVVQLELLSGAVGFEVNPPRHELADAE